MPPGVSKKLWTVEEVLHMQEAGILAPGKRLELIRGELMEMSPSGRKHVAAVARLHLFLIELLGRRVLIISQSSIELDPFSAPEPDIAVVRYREDFYAEHPIGPDDIFLFIEVADTSLDFDRKTKGQLYAEYGIPEYWILNLKGQCVEQFQLPGKNGYGRRSIVAKEGMLTIPGFDLKISVGEMLGLES
ncbi:MAG: Uma2 family endonuclease [Saprospirales bacterium]|nr:Uma2 family endonuclease [Saprospirales bacterium]